MRHLLLSKVATLVLLLLLALLPAAPAQADEGGDSFFAGVSSYLETLLAGWLTPGDEPNLGGSYPPSGSPESDPSALGYSFPPHGSTGDAPELGGSYPPGGDALNEEPPIDPELGGSYPPNG